MGIIFRLGTWGGTRTRMRVFIYADVLPSNTNTTQGPNFSSQNDADREGLYTATEMIEKLTFSTFFLY